MSWLTDFIKYCGVLGVLTSPRARKGARAVLDLSTEKITAPNSTAEETLWSTTLPAMSGNDTLELSMMLSQTNNANTKTLRIKVGAANALTAILASQTTTVYNVRIVCRNSPTAKMLVNVGASGNNTGLVTYFSSVDTSAAGVPFSISVQKTVGTDAADLEYACLELMG